jgi:hypothetical protein
MPIICSQKAQDKLKATDARFCSNEIKCFTIKVVDLNEPEDYVTNPSFMNPSDHKLM